MSNLNASVCFLSLCVEAVNTPKILVTKEIQFGASLSLMISSSSWKRSLLQRKQNAVPRDDATTTATVPKKSTKRTRSFPATAVAAVAVLYTTASTLSFGLVTLPRLSGSNEFLHYPRSLLLEVSGHEAATFSIDLQHQIGESVSLPLPWRARHDYKRNYNGLKISQLLLPFERRVRADDDFLTNAERLAVLKQQDPPLLTYQGESVNRFDDQDFATEPCIRSAWTYEIKPVCNLFHERVVLYQPDDIRYLGHGYYRDSYLFKESARCCVLKELRMKNLFDFDSEILSQIETEAVILERLSDDSTKITKMYGLCGGSVMVETATELSELIVPKRPNPFTDYAAYSMFTSHGRIPRDKLDQLQADDVHPMNNFAAAEKLDMAIAMAEGLAELHGFEGGVIVNDDVHPDQWLVNSKGEPVLNDMNNAHFLKWDRAKGEHCKYWIRFGGDYRAPEQYKGAYVDELADVWSFGAILFNLLTGLWSYYDYANEDQIQQSSIAGVKPYLDPRYQTRSFIEGRIVEIMNGCLQAKPSDRASIFEVVQHLRETKQINEQRK
jgi:hypothetical protein